MSGDEYGLDDDETWQLLETGDLWRLTDRMRLPPLTTSYNYHPTNHNGHTQSSSSSFAPRQQTTNSHLEQSNSASSSLTTAFTAAPSASTATSYAGSQQPRLPQHRRTIEPTINTRGLAPVADHTEDWLDLSQTEQHLDREIVYGYTRRSSLSSGTDPEQDAFEPVPTEHQMPTSTRSRHRQSIVDLTTDLTSPPNPSNPPVSLRKRSGVASGSTSAAKRARTGRLDNEVEELDLTNEAPSLEEELLLNQQQEAISAQRGIDEAGPQKVGRLTCNICLEHFTNATVTACGHIFCHECITQALIASERSTESATGKCPLCRKGLSRKRANNMVPVLFMKRSAFKGRHGIPG